MISFESFLKQWEPIKSFKIFIGLSGGVDSVVLLRMFHQTGFNIAALHVNYQLRGEESDGDEQFVRDLCDELGVELFVEKVNTNKILEEKGGNLQEVARNIRYDFYEKKLLETPASFIAVGHHQDDQVETFFLNIARKSGLRGLACMLEIDENKIRPLLAYSKDEIKQFALQNNWAWREDKSNLSIKYSRNALRNQYIPEMVGSVSSLNESVLFLIDTFQAELKRTQSAIQPIVENIKSDGFLSDIEFNNLNENEQVELLFQLGLTFSEIQSFYKLFVAQKGKMIELKDSKRIFREKNGFTFEHYFQVINFQIRITELDHIPTVFSKEEFYFDLTKINGEIKLRKWMLGDRISPIGLKGSKLISDVLNDAKLKVIEKIQWSVLVDDDGILACPYLSVSREKIAKQDSKRVICVKVSKC
jgi:tRNA(Ile)-lysidine synthase